MLLSKLISDLHTTCVIGSLDLPINAVTFDSRQVCPGTLFIAMSGTNVDGHKFIPTAISQGATAILCEQLPDERQDATYIQVESTAVALGLVANTWFNYPSRQLTLTGITGTNGKTTIATLLYKMVRLFGKKAGLLSTVCNYIDDEAVPSTHTTPDPLELNALLRRMVDAGCEYAFMEVSSHSVVQERIAGLDFNGGVFTNLTRDHIDYHKTFENYRDAKKAFFDRLPKSAFAVTNKDDRNGLFMTQNTAAQVRTYSLQTLADFKGLIVEENFDGMEMTINGNDVILPLIGRFNAYNALAIYGTAVSLGFEPLEVLRIMSMLTPVNGRFESIRSPKGWTAIVDYAHTPDAVANVINTINDIRPKGSSLITVVGCGGNRDKGKRPMMAQEAVKGSTRVILTSDNPRDEEPQDILNDMLEGLDDRQRMQTLTIIDRREAIRTACMLAQPKDVILIAGKGHEDYQIIKGVKHHFDDHEVVKEMI